MGSFTSSWSSYGHYSAKHSPGLSPVPFNSCQCQVNAGKGMSKGSGGVVTLPGLCIANVPNSRGHLPIVPRPKNQDVFCNESMTSRARFLLRQRLGCHLTFTLPSRRSEMRDDLDLFSRQVEASIGACCQHFGAD
jgi:hypothetical protein